MAHRTRKTRSPRRAPFLTTPEVPLLLLAEHAGFLEVELRLVRIEGLRLDVAAIIKMVEDELAANGFSQGEIQGGGLKIITTLNKSMQEAAIAAAQENTATAAEAAEGTVTDIYAPRRTKR